MTYPSMKILTESRTKSENKKMGLYFFVRISGNERKVPSLGVLESNKNGRSGLIGMEMERRWDERKWNQ